MARSDIRTTLRRIRRQLGSGHRNEFGALRDTIDATTTTIVFDADLPASVKANSILNIELEQMRVRTVDTSTQTVTVQRDWADSVAATHTAGEEIAINPRFSLLDIYEEMIGEVESWGPHLWKVAQQTFPVGSTTETIELPIGWSDAYGVLGVSRYISGETDSTKWPTLTGWRMLRSGVGVLNSALTSGQLLRLGSPMVTGSVHVAVALPLSLQDRQIGEDLIDDVGLPSSSLDLLELGVRLRLLSHGESGRSARQAQGDARRAEETPVGSMVPVLQLLERQYARRMAQEQRKLQARYPIGFH